LDQVEEERRDARGEARAGRRRRGDAEPDAVARERELAGKGRGGVPRQRGGARGGRDELCGRRRRRAVAEEEQRRCVLRLGQLVQNHLACGKRPPEGTERTTVGEKKKNKGDF
jgi:hypothetical protein